MMLLTVLALVSVDASDPCRVDEKYGPSGPNTCFYDYQCRGERTCGPESRIGSRIHYCEGEANCELKKTPEDASWDCRQDERFGGPKGAHSCAHPRQCRGERTCQASGWCTGEANCDATCATEPFDCSGEPVNTVNKGSEFPCNPASPAYGVPGMCNSALCCAAPGWECRVDEKVAHAFADTNRAQAPYRGTSLDVTHPWVVCKRDVDCQGDRKCSDWGYCHGDSNCEVDLTYGCLLSDGTPGVPQWGCHKGIYVGAPCEKTCSKSERSVESNDESAGILAANLESNTQPSAPETGLGDRIARMIAELRNDERLGNDLGL